MMRMAQPSNRGVAILMVIAVLAGLMALAAPFVLSMVLHGRAARSDMHAMQARLGAEAAQAHALAQLYKNTIRLNPVQGEPEVTTLNDLKVSMDFPAASKDFEKIGLNVQNPNGLIWSAKVEDEQAKVNLNSAPPALVGNLLGSAILTESAQKGAMQIIVDDGKQFPPGGGLVSLIGERQALRYVAVQGNVISLQDPTTLAHFEGALVFDGRAQKISDYKFSRGGPSFLPYRSIYEIKLALASNQQEALNPDEFARLEKNITTTSGIDGPLWGHGERPREQGAGLVDGFNVEKGDGFTPGALIRVVENGEAQNYARVRRVLPRRDGGAYVELDNPIGVGDNEDYTRYIQPELRHPVNINTASQSVIEACLMGVCIYSGKEAIRKQTAQMLTEHLLGSGIVFRDATGLKKAFDDAHAKGIITSQQRDALYINATEPGSPKLRTATVPFCFFSFGSYTIEGSGIVNSENGVQFARNTTRQLVTLPTPWPGRFKVEWQYGFQNLLEQGLGSRVVTFPLPMGTYKYKRNGVVRLPSLKTGNIRLDVGKSGAHNLAGEFLEHCEDENDPGYRQDGYDMRKRGPFIIPLGGNNSGRSGANPGNLAPGQNPTLVAGANNNNNNNNQQQQLTNPSNPNQTACRPTAVELWYRPLGGGQCVFFDESLEDDRNRVTFSYEPGHQIAPGLVVQIYDAGLECQDVTPKEWQHLRRKPVECVYPAQFDGSEWYHVAASWKTGGFNGQDIRLDAQPVPYREEIRFRPSARLSGGLGIDDTELELEPDDPDFESHFPKAGGAILVGEEIIEYRQRQGGSFQQLTRGARMSAAQKHNDGELAVPFGFSNGLGQDLPVGGATLVERIERPTAMRNCRVEIPPNVQLRFILDSETAKIPVSDASDFPPSGFVTIGGELIYYGKRTATVLQNLQRAQRSGNTGAPARNINDRAGVRLASIEITDTSQYDAPGIVQIDDDQDNKIVEWIAYAGAQVMNGKHYLTARLASGGQFIQVGNPPVQRPGNSIGISEFRNHFGICTSSAGRESSHDKKTKVIPVISMRGPHCGNQRSPYGELGVSELTVIERGTTHADLMYVKQAYIEQYPDWRWIGPNGTCPAVWVDWRFRYYVGLNDFVSRRYPGNTSRMIKWPSGELPDTVGARRIVGADRAGDGMLRGHVDEIKVNTFNTYGGRIAMTTSGQGIAAGDEEILIEEHTAWPVPGSGGNVNLNWPATGGLVRIEGELLFYKSLSQTAIQYFADVLPTMKEKAERTARNPCPPNVIEPHANIETKTVMRLSGVIRGVLGTQADEHPVGAKAMLLDGMAVSILRGPFHGGTDSFSVADGRGFAPEGYAWIGNEVVSYLQNSGTSFTGCRYFRGRFGTSEQEHDVDEIVRSLPFRYWDREAKQYDGPGLAYIQAGYSAADAVWDGIELHITGTEEHPAPPPRVKPRVLLRFDQKPPWDVNPTNQDGGIFEISGKSGVIPLRASSRSGGVRADQIEMRVYWEFLRGAFLPNQDWKRTFSIERMRATYSTPLIMRRLDEVEKR